MTHKNMRPNSSLQTPSNTDPQPISKEAFCRFCHTLYHARLVGGAGGNISAKNKNEIFLTPTGYALRDVTPETISIVKHDGTLLDGPPPTKEVAMHLGVLQARPEIRTVCHLHGAHIIAATCRTQPGPDTLPPVTPGFVYHAHPVSMIPFLVPGSDALTRAVIHHFSTSSSPALLMQNHGLITIGRDFQEALNIAEEINEAAEIFVLTNGLPHVISEEDVLKIKRIR
jgi:ribulose-5-phosphate 4-epimerase/fuculose-1-phosphate aldolase